jgi:hypothetical protein
MKELRSARSNVVMRRSTLAGSLAAVLAAGCGTSPHEAVIDVGTDGDGGGPTFVSDAASSGSALDASIEQMDIAVRFVTVSCANACADVVAVATGGNPPYTFRWDDGSSQAMRHLCPTATTNYGVTVTDTARGGELASPSQSVSVPLTAKVIACPDAGPPPTDTCDAVTPVSTAGANPWGHWAYGSTASLGAAFARYTEYVRSPSSNGNLLTGLDAWSSGVNGVDLTPFAQVNPGPPNVQVTMTGTNTVSTWTIPTGTFMLHPGALGQYSVARWTAPQAGTFRVRATFTGIANPPAMTTTDVHVQHNGTDLAGAAGGLNVNQGGNTFSVDQSVSVAAGDTLDFAVGDGGNGFLSDTTALDAAVCSGP